MKKKLPRYSSVVMQRAVGMVLESLQYEPRSSPLPARLAALPRRCGIGYASTSATPVSAPVRQPIATRIWSGSQRTAPGKRNSAACERTKKTHLFLLTITRNIFFYGSALLHRGKSLAVKTTILFLELSGDVDVRLTQAAYTEHRIPFRDWRFAMLSRFFCRQPDRTARNR